MERTTNEWINLLSARPEIMDLLDVVRSYPEELQPDIIKYAAAFLKGEITAEECESMVRALIEEPDHRNVKEQAEQGKQIIEQNMPYDMSAAELEQFHAIESEWEKVTTAFYFGVTVGSQIRGQGHHDELTAAAADLGEIEQALKQYAEDPDNMELYDEIRERLQKDWARIERTLII